MLFTTVIRTVSFRNTSTGCGYGSVRFRNYVLKKKKRTGAGYCPLIRIAPFLASAGTLKGFCLSAGDLSSTVGRLKSTTHSLTSNVYSTTSLNAKLRIHTQKRKTVLNIFIHAVLWIFCSCNDRCEEIGSTQIPGFPKKSSRARRAWRMREREREIQFEVCFFIYTYQCVRERGFGD